MADDDHRPPPSPGWRHARPDEIGLFGINSADKANNEHETLLSTKTGRMVFYGAITFSLGMVSYCVGGTIYEGLMRKLRNGRGI